MWTTLVAIQAQQGAPAKNKQGLPTQREWAGRGRIDEEITPRWTILWPVAAYTRLQRKCFSGDRLEMKECLQYNVYYYTSLRFIAIRLREHLDSLYK